MKRWIGQNPAARPAGRVAGRPAGPNSVPWNMEMIRKRQVYKHFGEFGMPFRVPEYQNIKETPGFIGIFVVPGC